MHPRAVLRRLAGALLLLWLVLTTTFALIRLAPGDAATFLISPSASAADVARVRAEFGLDQSIMVQYARWAGRLLHGDLGESFSLHQPVARALADALPVSIGLGAASLALTFLIGVPIGIVQAVRRGKPLDYILTVLTT
ncbi:MAG TPA: ABC transporter permease, partial [Gemmatimonadaceae bacterium]